MEQNINYKNGLKSFLILTLATACCFGWLMPQALTEYSLLLQLAFTLGVLALNCSLSSTPNKLSYINIFILLIASVVPFIIIFLGHKAFSPSKIYGELLCPLHLLAFAESTYTLLLMERKNSPFYALLITLVLGCCTTFNIVFTLYYALTGAVFDDFALLAIYQTNYQEALGYIKTFISYPLLALGIFLEGFNLLFLYRNFRSLSVKYPPTEKKKITLVFSFVLLFELALLFTHTPDDFMLRTIKTTNSTIKSYKEYCEKHKSSRDGVMQAKIDAIKRNSKHGTYILIIGESETRDHMGAYGYQRDTTPWLTKEFQLNPNFILFSHAYSCDYGTVKVLSQALTETNEYNNIPIQKSVSIIDIAKKAGFETVWLSNQMRYGIFDSPTTALAESTDKQVWLNHNSGGLLTISDHYDGDLLPKLQELGPSPEKDRLIIIHLMGCHAAYEDRYPPQFKKFTTSNGIKDISSIKDIKKYNEYDNAIYYNDYVLQEIFTIGQKELKATAIIYMSDHGEEVRLGYGHNPPLGSFDYTLLRIPFFIAYNPNLLPHTALIANLKSHIKLTFTSDLLYDTLIGLMEIRTSHYNSKYDLSSSSFSLKTEDLKVTKKQYKINEDLSEK